MKFTFPYGDAEIEHLKRRDKKLSAVIEKVGRIEREVRPNRFESLLRSITSQQISSKAADSIWNRLNEKFSPLSSRIIAGAATDEVQKCGLSFRKAGYIKGVADAVECGTLDFSQFELMGDDEVIKRLSALNGVGVWTAEMFLIFSMCRPDVVSWGDLAIRRGMMNVYGLTELTKEQFEQYRKKYSPHGSVASFYLWEMSR